MTTVFPTTTAASTTAWINSIILSFKAISVWLRQHSPKCYCHSCMELFFLKSTTLHHNICRVMHFPCILLLTIGSSLCFTWNLFCTCRNFNFVFPRWNDYYAIHSIRPEYFFRKKNQFHSFFFSCQHFKGLQYNKLGLRWFIVFRLAFLLFFPWNRTADNCTILCLIVLY